MPKVVRISKEQSSKLLNHAENSLPNEAVALLFGTISNDVILTKRVEYLANESITNQTSFSVNPEDQYALLMDADNRGESMIGIFHSHPAPPRPSHTDIRNMRLNPVVWIVASKITGNWAMRAYVLEEETPVEIDIQLVALPTDAGS